MLKKIKTLIGNNLILAHSISGMRGIIEIPEYLRDYTSSCVVVKIGTKVKLPLHVGDRVLCQNSFGERTNLKDGNLFLSPASNVMGLLKRNTIMPYGNTLLIRRDKKCIETIGGIIIPERRRGQSLGGTVEAFGISRKTILPGLQLGDYVLIKEWQPHIIEVQLPDKGYGLIVKDIDLLCIVEKETQITHNNQTYKP
jgi:co-chaperonin GroES (HSP10)